MSVVDQKILFELYRSNAARGVSRPDWRSLGFRAQSQHDEDGYLLFIFSLLGFRSRKVVEICCGNGRESNTANLLINHRCTGVLFDGNKENCDAAVKFYKECQDTTFWPPVISNAWITAENVNDLLNQAGIGGEIDLLSIDIDGIDYWLWEAIEAINPRVVVAEINHLWGDIESRSVPYSADFKAEFTQYGSDYAGASIAAFVKLARRKNYRLVGANSIATNVFFVRNDIQHSWLPEVEAETIYWHPRSEFGRTVRFEGIRNKKWVTID